eukprot:COSAG04_NODE_11523_length_704_cov_1.295868_1_plen_74_part_10
MKLILMLRFEFVAQAVIQCRHTFIVTTKRQTWRNFGLLLAATDIMVPPPLLRPGPLLLLLAAARGAWAQSPSCA